MQTYYALYSSFVVDEKSFARVYRPFRRGQSQPLDNMEWGGPSRAWASPMHTNQPRAGDWGLPKGWTLVPRIVHVLCDRQGPAIDEFLIGSRARLWCGDTVLPSWRLAEAIIPSFERVPQPFVIWDNAPFGVDVIVPTELALKGAGPLVNAAPRSLADDCATIARSVREHACPPPNERPPFAPHGLEAEGHYARLEENLRVIAAHIPTVGETTFWIVLEGSGEVVFY